MPTFEVLAPIIKQRWNDLVPRPGYDTLAAKVANRLADNVSRYIALASRLTVPTAFIMLAHEREASGSFSCYLGNGDPISRPTTHVPIGRGPFADFEAGAIDAIKYEGLDKLTGWGVELLFYWLEAFNGWGYFYKGLPSPYIWAGSTLQRPGKFIADNVFDPDVMDVQLGAALIYQALIQIVPNLALPS